MKRAHVGTHCALAATVVLAFLVRVVGQWTHVFGGGDVRLPGVDPWYHLRQIERFVGTFPQRPTFDALALHPAGQRVGTAPLLDALVATAAWLVGLGSPSPSTVEMVAALTPPVLGALLCVVVYALTRRLAGRGAGLLAALAVAVVPGHALSRSMLGFCDHHVLESLLATGTILAFARACAADKTNVARRVADAGVTLGLYLLAWKGGALLLLPLAAFLVGQQMLAVRRGHLDQTAPRCSAALVIAALVVLPFSGSLPGVRFHVTGLVLALLAAAVPFVVRRMLGERASAGRMALGLGAVVALLALVVGVIAPDVLLRLVRGLRWFRGSGLQQTVTEAQPLLVEDGAFTLARAWRHFGVTLPLALVGLVVLARRAVRDACPDHALVVAWTAAMLLATLGQNRFGYYLAACAAVLTGVVLGPPLTRLWAAAAGPPVWVRRVLWPCAAVAAIAVPLAPATLRIASARTGPRAAWVETLDWMRTETPSRSDVKPYGVLAWWDAGWWIAQRARRAPVANATQAGARRAARLLLERRPDRAAKTCRERGIRYVVVDGALPMIPAADGELTGTVPQLRAWARDGPDELVATYYLEESDRSLRPLTVFHAA